ncbi:MAG: Ig-like domain-containing protein [Gemmatimonadota bacterium]|jgi:hypothetical protein
MFRHAYYLGALLMLSTAPILLACDDSSSILGSDQVGIDQMAMPDSVTLEVGQALLFKVPGTNPHERKRSDQEVRWSSSDPQVATVSDRGVVQALAEGTALITADCGTYCIYTEVKVVA